DAHLAEDAAQEAFVEVFRGLSTLRQPKRFPQWLTTICRRHASRLAKTWKHDEYHTADSVDGRPPLELQVIVNEALNRLDQTSLHRSLVSTTFRMWPGQLRSTNES